jgi:hypothetical protein
MLDTKLQLMLLTLLLELAQEKPLLSSKKSKSHHHQKLHQLTKRQLLGKMEKSGITHTGSSG